MFSIIFRVDSGSVDLETPLELSPRSPLEVLDDALDILMPNLECSSKPTPPPRNKLLSKHEKDNCGTTDPFHQIQV